MAALLSRAVAARDELAAGGARTPLLVKIAPDLSNSEISEISEILVSSEVDGVVATNTTLSRDGLRSAHKDQAGGLSGAPLTAKSLDVLKKLRRATGGALPIVGVGGIGSAAQAYERIRAGASLVQLYTAMVYEGPSLGRRINEGLAELLRRAGFASPAEAVGVDVPV